MTDGDYVIQAIHLAEKSVEKGGFPAGAVVVKDGEVVSSGISIGFSLHDPTSHAETAAIREACQKLQTTDLSGAILYESVECCVMCFSVAYWAGISKIVYAVRKTDEMVSKGYYEGKTKNEIINKENNRQIDLRFLPEHEEKSFHIIKEWEARGGFNQS